MKRQTKVLDFIEKWPIALMPLLVLVAIPFTVYSQPQSISSTAAAPQYSASFSLSPTQETMTPGEIFEVLITLDTGEAVVDGADAILRYNPRMLGVVGLEGGGLFEEYIQREVDEVGGRIRLSGLSLLDAQPKDGVFGTVFFEPLQKGVTTVFFEFTPGATRGDSNVALTGAGGVDILKEVGNAQYVIE